MTRVACLERFSSETSSAVAPSLLLGVMLVVTVVQADVEWVDMSGEAQEEWVIHWGVPGSVRHSIDRSYGAAQQRRATEGAQQRRGSVGAQQRHASLGAQERRASLGAQERRSVQGAEERGVSVYDRPRYGSVRHDSGR